MNIRAGQPNDIAACGDILRSLPEWFGIESSIADYLTSLETDPFWVCEEQNVIGFIAVKRRYRYDAELAVMAVDRSRHRRSIGSALLEHVCDALREEDVEYLQVKTLSPSANDTSYASTRRFYEKHHFRKLEEFPTIWSPGNPAMQYIKAL